ncbi:ethanolamine utilization protein EutH [Pseudomonas juntendi]|jgi:ethanolamine transporter|uniref:Ethanolamine utilization protein EutH n=1 Tax=Pseudomonas juntendi TaxID=2666183 RepID=A0A7W2QTG0_9PSED|nr:MULTISPECIES: ethanolamine utilization protein EutH [Pseudomonas]PPB16375.1 ethanolamine utilization protein EutH [Pseudomonas aeruginosa]MBA6057877.1 ethanolamine utilization protein EutH [Pseudomonas juntendi]MBA6096500.1 ethanolamine utilization protein EutH [Pseudomonas juntendi]MBA6120079.1 ethanolamine utilization protein EutH [Pseudomonas juntendi]MBA6125180.1 ethanolamine utilization protein EutH [Pseudomonas juntendi]
MESIGTYVIYVIMVCAVLGALASIYNPEGELGQEFIAGLHSIGPIFIPVAGIMAAIPYISAGISQVIAPLFQLMGADPGTAGPIFIASDMGGYQLAKALAQSPEGWILGLITGFQSGSTIIFVIPVGLAMLRKVDHKYMALGIMAGLLAIPLSIMIIAMAMQGLDLGVRPDIATTGAATQALHFSWAMLLRNLMPLILFCIALAAALRYCPALMVYLFLKLGQFMYIAVVLVLVASIVQYFTGLFSHVFGSWGFAPIIADADDQFRALEIAGYVGLMLCGAFPMVHLLKRFLARPIERVASRFGMSGVGAAGVLAASANILAMFRLVSEMPPKDKVLVIAFSVCAAFTFGDHMAFSANFQPSLILPLMIGKLSGGLIAMLLASWLAVPKAQEMGRQDDAAGAFAVAPEPS